MLSLEFKQRLPAPQRGPSVGSAGPELRPCGPSSGAGCRRAVGKTIQILLDYAPMTTAWWKSPKAGERALRYAFSISMLLRRYLWS